MGRLWSGMVFSTIRTKLRILREGSLIAARYMHDNTRPHAAGYDERENEFKVHLELETLQWPAYSLNLNPIEHGWGTLERALRHLNLPLMTLMTTLRSGHTRY